MIWSFFRRTRRGPASSARLLDPARLDRHRRNENETLIRGLCETAYLGGGSALCRVLGRYKMFVDTGDVGLSPHLMLDGYWEMWLTEALVAELKPGMVAVDIGANLGYFTLLMADQVGEDGAVHAFEPNPPIADRLVNSVNVNGFRERVTLHREPLGSQDGLAVSLSVPREEPKNAHLTTDPAGVDGIRLTARRFDSFPELLRADLIKIDAEGAELDIWRGMSGLFDQASRPLTIFLEFAAVRYAQPGAFLDEIMARGFSLGDLSPTEGIRPRSRAQILAAPAAVDQMLVLRR